MISLEDAFAKFKSRLELNDREQADVSRQHNELRDVIRDAFEIERDILTGSYKRHTKTKPLKDVDVFFVLGGSDAKRYRELPPAEVLAAFQTTLSEHYRKDRVCPERRCVTVNFDVRGQEDRVLSIDAVPAFADGAHYSIPDRRTGGWVLTNPELHASLTTEANKAFGCEWKPMVKMLKKWNEQHGKPIKPSFLVEVMALSLLRPPFSGGYPYELKAFFATAAGRIRDVWPDPAGLGTPVSDRMDAAQCTIAEAALREAGRQVDLALLHARNGRSGDALRVWREGVFGPLFPLS